MSFLLDRLKTPLAEAKSADTVILVQSRDRVLTNMRDSSTDDKIWKELKKRMNKHREKKIQAKNIVGGGDLEAKIKNLVATYYDSTKLDSNYADVVRMWTRMVETGDRLPKGDYDKIVRVAYFAVTLVNASRKALIGSVTNLEWAGRQPQGEGGGVTVHVGANSQRLLKTGNDAVVYMTKNVVQIVQASLDARDNYFEGTVSISLLLLKTSMRDACKCLISFPRNTRIWSRNLRLPSSAPAPASR